MGQIWLERLLRWNAKIQKLLVGRYARMDQLNNTLMKISLILLLLNLFLPTSIAFWLAVVLLIWINYRFFSKRIYPRSNENTRYVANMQQLKRSSIIQNREYMHAKPILFSSVRIANNNYEHQKVKGRSK